MSIKSFLTLCFTIFFSFQCQTTSQSSGGSSSPKENVIQSKLGIIATYINSGKLRTALKEMNQLKRFESDRHDVQLMDGLVHLALDNYIKAEQGFKNSYKLKKTIPALLNLSSVYLKWRKIPKAIKALKMIESKLETQKYQFPERVYLNLGIAHVHSKQYDQAREYFHKSVQENPTYHVGWVQLGKQYQRKGKTKEALKAFRKGVQFCKNCIEPNVALSKFFLKNKNYVESVKLLTSYLKQKKIDGRHRKIAGKLLKFSRKKFLR